MFVGFVTNISYALKAIFFYKSHARGSLWFVWKYLLLHISWRCGTKEDKVTNGWNIYLQYFYGQTNGWTCIHILNRTLFLSLWAVIGHLLTASNAVCNKRIIQFAPNHLLPLNRLLSAKKLVVNVRYNPQTNFLLWNWRWNRILSLRISLQSNFWFSKSYDDRCKCDQCKLSP